MKRFLKLLLIATCLFLFTIFNLEANAVYYAQHSKVVKKEAVPFILLNHLWWYLDAESVTEGNYSYDVKGHPDLFYKEKELRYEFFLDVTAETDFALVIVNNSTTNKWYLFDDKFQLVAIEQEPTWNKLPITEEEEIYARDALQKVSKDLLDKTTAPLINLQLLYDLLHMIK